MNTKEFSNQGGEVHKVTVSSNYSRRKPWNKKQSHQKNDENRAACFRCGARHKGECKYAKEKCYKCGEIGHISRTCRKPSKQKEANVKLVDRDADLEESEDEELGIFTIQKDRALTVSMMVEGERITMQIDTGAAVTVISKELYQEKFKHLPLQPTKMILRTYSGEKLELLGKILVHVQYGDHSAEVPLVVVNGVKPALLGRNWLQEFQLD